MEMNDPTQMGKSMVILIEFSFRVQNVGSENFPELTHQAKRDRTWARLQIILVVKMG